jgi:hypothetical protein
MFYFLVRYIIKGELLKGGNYDPAIVGECTGCPLGIMEGRFRKLVPDPFERAVLLTTGIIVEYRFDHDSGGMLPTRAWRAKKGTGSEAVMRGHRIKIKD